MFVVSYLFIVAFQPSLKLERNIVYRSYVHSLEQLTSLDYLTSEQIGFIEPYLIQMLKDVAFEVSKRKSKVSLGQMFSIKSALVKKTLLNWFNAKYSKQFAKVNPFKKLIFEQNNPIKWGEDKCVICKFPLKLSPTNCDTPDNEMTFGDFMIRYEHKFLRNIYSNEQLKQSEYIENIKNYYCIFEKYIQICIGILALLNSCNRNQFLNDATEEFVEENFQCDNLTDIKNTINKTEIKNLIKNSGNINKFNLKVYAYVYNELLTFPSSSLDYETITTNKLFLHTHQLIKGKTHLHHSHVTGEIIGFAHDFCNQRVKEKQNADIPFIAHNFFGFDRFYFLKTFVATAWCTKYVNVGGNHLTHVNYGNIQNETKN